jgi:hypothetical protein
VVITVGDPIAVQRDAEPSRERAQATAERILVSVKALEKRAMAKCG